MLQNAGVFNILTCKCASRHSSVQFFDIKPPKSGPYPSVFPHFDLQICFAPQPRAIFQHRNVQNGSDTVSFWHFHLQCASRHSRVPFLNIGTCKMAPRMWCFAHFDLQMCFAPQRRAIFEHQNFKKCSDTISFLAFSLPNVLYATAGNHFSPVC